MKKFIQISILLVLAIALIIGLFQIGIGSELAQAGSGSACRVGWNTRTRPCLALGTGLKGPILQPNVGWNG
jgi:hypothetical protein